MGQPESIGTPSKIAVAAAGILLITVVLMMVFGDREWKGLETLLTASMLVPLATVSWPLVEMGGNRMLFGIDAARQAIWQRQQRELAAAREEGRQEGRAEARDEGRAEARDEGRKEGRAEAREEGRKEGYQQGYDDGVSATQRRSRRRRILRNDR